MINYCLNAEEDLKVIGCFVDKYFCPTFPQSFSNDKLTLDNECFIFHRLFRYHAKTFMYDYKLIDLR